jgi:hypothetical protein
MYANHSQSNHPCEAINSNCNFLSIKKYKIDMVKGQYHIDTKQKKNVKKKKTKTSWETQNHSQTNS